MSGWLPTAPCTPEACVPPPDPVVGLARRLLRTVVCAGVLVAGITLAPLVRSRSRRVARLLVRAWARLLVASLGVRLRSTALRTTALRSGGPALLVVNHVSWLDILLVAAVCPGRMLAKTEVRAWPAVGPLAAWGGTLFIDRDRLRALPGTVDQVAAALRRGERVVVFPEGSTWCGRGGGRFRPALFQAAIGAGAPVEPVALRYRRTDGQPTSAPAFVGDDDLISSLRRVIAQRGLVAEVVLPPAIAPGAHPARRPLARAAQAGVDRHRFAGLDGCPNCRATDRASTARPLPAALPLAAPARAAWCAGPWGGRTG
ncbi:lysophospholipid acyltransferase family protein, partial [Kitasatospora nipponensis]|uniref:lysophospholipid acyltransferase family protein n=1 Tax=Kitasatospora nipponensis TaxID=258049 RepID=UPI0031D0C442